jgi:hypothetical protein
MTLAVLVLGVAYCIMHYVHTVLPHWLVTTLDFLTGVPT